MYWCIFSLCCPALLDLPTTALGARCWAPAPCAPRRGCTCLVMTLAGQPETKCPTYFEAPVCGRLCSSGFGYACASRIQPSYLTPIILLTLVQISVGGQFLEKLSSLEAYSLWGQKSNVAVTDAMGRVRRSETSLRFHRRSLVCLVAQAAIVSFTIWGICSHCTQFSGKRAVVFAVTRFVVDRVPFLTGFCSNAIDVPDTWTRTGRVCGWVTGSPTGFQRHRSDPAQRPSGS